MSHVSGRFRLGLFRQVGYAIGNFGVAFSPAVVAAWLGYFYYGRTAEDGSALAHVTPSAFGTIWFLCNALNGPTDPIVGYLSDNMRSRWGRRKPFVLVGAPLLALSFFFLWTPITKTPSLANEVLLFLSLFGFWLFFTVVVAPYLSLLPEITPVDRERVRISAFMGAFEVLGNIGGNLVPPLLAAVLASGVWFLSSGYQVMALAAGVALVAFFWIAVLSVDETYEPPKAQRVKAGSMAKGIATAFREFGSTFKNPAFKPYLICVGFYRTAIATVVFIAPFITTKVLASYAPSEADKVLLSALGAVDEGVINWEIAAGYMMMLVLVGGAMLFPLVSYLAARLGKKLLFIIALAWFGVTLTMMAFVGHYPALTPLMQTAVIFLLSAFPVSIALVVIRPLLADVIDADEDITGRRREGVYNGMEGLVMKVAAGLGPMLAGFLFAAFGNEPGHDLGIRICGPVAGACLLVAAYAFTRYPIER